MMEIQRLGGCALGLVSAFLGATSVAAMTPAGPFVLTAAVDDPGIRFGSAVALEGDTLLVGAYWHPGPGGALQGAVYVFRWTGSGWSQEAILQASDGSAGDEFGRFVALDNGTAIVGAALDDGPAGTDQGAVYVFTRTGASWTQQAKLVASDAGLTDQFGVAGDISADTIVVGAHRYDGVSMTDPGAAYVFTRASGVWTEQAILMASDAGSLDRFGISASIDGDTIVVGSHLDDDDGSQSGSAYVFAGGSGVWTEVAKLTASDAAAGDQLGASSVIDGDTIVVGAPLKDGVGQEQGAAYVFRWDGVGWVEEQKLLPADSDGGDRFGQSLSLDGHSALIGGHLHSHGGIAAGSAFVFDRADGVWTEADEIRGLSPVLNDNFGFAVAIDDGIAAVGAELAEVGSIANAGTVTVYERVDDSWIGPDARVVASDPQSSAFFGTGVDIAGDTAIVGAYAADGVAVDSGAAYVLERTGAAWTEVAKLTPSAGGTGDYFGFAVAIEDDIAIVGAHVTDTYGPLSGMAHAFKKVGSTWMFDRDLDLGDTQSGDFHGYAVAVAGAVAAIGAPKHGVTFTQTGAVYLWERIGGSWFQRDTAVAADRATGDNFGLSVSMSGDTLLVGAPNDDDDGDASGSAYVFVRSGNDWQQQAKLTASDASANDLFGQAVALDGDTAIVGAPYDDTFDTDSGSVYVFVRSGTTWTQQAKLTAADRGSDDRFGFSVDLDGDQAIIGAWLDDDLGVDSGSAYVFSRSGTVWSQQTKLLDTSGVAGDEFGTSVALSGGVALVGSPNRVQGAAFAGAARFFQVGGESAAPFVQNATAATAHGSLIDAINGASTSHVLSATATAFQTATPTDYLGKLLSISSKSRIRQPYLNDITLADGASLNAGPGDAMTLYGRVTLPAGDGSTLRAASLRLGAGASMTLFGNSALNAITGPTSIDGDFVAFPGGSAAFSGPVTVGGEFALLSGAMSAPLLNVAHGGRFVGDGTLATSVTNSDAFVTVDSALITGDLTNNAGAKVTVQIGTLTLLGSLTNNGTIVGDLQTLLRGAQTQPGDGFSVGGDYRAGAEASLLMPSDLWRVSVGGDFDVAIDKNAKYDMAQATLRIGGALPTDLERMSVDIGNSPDGLDRTMAGHFPIGTLRLTGNVTNLVDNHDNDGLGQGSCEALYVSALIIDAGAALNTNGCPVYYETLTNNGSVDDPLNLIQISACVADINNDGIVNGADLATLLASWGSANAASDLNGDGNVDGADLAVLLASWGAC